MFYAFGAQSRGRGTDLRGDSGLLVEEQLDPRHADVDLVGVGAGLTRHGEGLARAVHPEHAAAEAHVLDVRERRRRARLNPCTADG